MAHIKIKEVATLQSGFPLGSKQFVEDGNAWVLQGGSISRVDAQIQGFDKFEGIEPAEDAIILSRGPNDMLRQANIPKLTPEKTVQVGDVLFRARTPNFEQLKAYVLFPTEDSFFCGKPHVITNTFIKMRPKKVVLPRYLAWAINNFRSGLHLNSSRSGAASIVTVSIKQLAEVELPIPDLKTQKIILSASEEIEKAKAIADASNYAANELLCGLAQKHS